jgi:cell division protein FtsB
VVGSRGLLAWRQLNRDIEATEQELAAVRAERQELEDKVRRLRPDSLDADLIDEVARRRLSLAEPLDVIILLDQEGGSR